ncbi:AEL296Wp [Eremothecium gossypii ATCC 10895]|uniref:AEL296Wp n=1 Tax=Eremothecium gossypii (strain ATCC 10895 / CBS 109.51 / FGSC 9923 / NRRL Y-1056) TaxID=284811 RepID=Q758P9_EREGS|nr:AEL296Wp [Eremothecium gossypii ATCC 10895]AAS52388.1 AEL296Wp [Eremothecium gossypii ATCC 10895]
MDELLSRAGSQAVSFAIKSSVSLASTYAIKQFTKFLTGVPQQDASRLQKLRRQLETRIDIINNAIVLIKLCVVRGNTNLKSTLSLILDLKDELAEFNGDMEMLSSASVAGKLPASKNGKAGVDAVSLMEAKMSELIHRIELVIPLINLSMTTSGVSSSMKLPSNVSPSLLLQASNYVVKSNEQALADNYEKDVQVGPLFSVTVYDIFDKSSKIIWKETMARCDLRIVRISSNIPDRGVEYNYHLELKENFDDDRYHDIKEDKPRKLHWNVEQITRLFFTMSGKLLNLEERDSPVLVLKLVKSLGGESGESNESLHWLAVGEYEPASDLRDSDDDIPSPANADAEAPGQDSDNEDSYDSAQEDGTELEISSSLSLLEYIIKLTSLQNHDQASILDVKDERLSLYLNDENPNSVKRQPVVEDVTAKFSKISMKDELPVNKA